MATEKRHIPIMDIYQAAFLALHQNEPTLIKQGNRVVFEFPGTEKILKLLGDYNHSPSIELLPFVGHLRRLRAMMLSMRDSQAFGSRLGESEQSHQRRSLPIEEIKKACELSKRGSRVPQEKGKV